jgi:hypothetical protein
MTEESMTNDDDAGVSTCCESVVPHIAREAPPSEPQGEAGSLICHWACEVRVKPAHRRCFIDSKDGFGFVEQG